MGARSASSLWLAVLTAVLLLVSPPVTRAHAAAPSPVAGHAMAGMKMGGCPDHHAADCAEACRLACQMIAAPTTGLQRLTRAPAPIRYDARSDSADGVTPARATPPPRLISSRS